jgi:hypothetical protein
MADQERDFFTREMIARHNAIPEGNARKSSGQDRGKYENYCPPVPGQGEYDSVVVAKESGND